MKFQRDYSALLIAVRYPSIEYKLRLAINLSKRDSHSSIRLNVSHISAIGEYDALMRDFQVDSGARGKRVLGSNEASKDAQVCR